jgi:chemotaxis response regulator CheB
MVANMNLNELIEPEKPDPEPARTRKAVLWGREDLLSRAISLFLEARMSWDVIKVTSNGNVDGLIQKIERVKPDVVILCQETVEGDSELPLRVLDEQHCLKVVTLSLENNLMQVYSKQKIMIRGVADLLSIVESDDFPKDAQEKEARHA